MGGLRGREVVGRCRAYRASDAAGSQECHPSPGVQPRGGNRQIRTTVPPLARGVTPVIAGAKAVGYLDVASDEMSQTFNVLSPLPLTPPALRHLWSRLRSLPAGLRYGSAHQTCPRLRRPT